MQSVQARRTASRGFVHLMDRLNDQLTRLCGVALAVMVLSVFIGVLARFVFTHTAVRISVPWTEEVSRYLMIWTVFIGAGIACRHGKLIGVEFLVGILPAALGQAAKYVSLLLAIAFYGLLCFIGWQWVEFGQSQTSPVLQVPLVAVNLAMMLGGVLMALNTIAMVLATRSAGRDIRAAAEDDELESALQQVNAREATDSAGAAGAADSQLSPTRGHA